MPARSVELHVELQDDHVAAAPGLYAIRRRIARGNRSLELLELRLVRASPKSSESDDDGSPDGV
jgi:hypothetical protein